MKKIISILMVSCLFFFGSCALNPGNSNESQSKGQGDELKTLEQKTVVIIENQAELSERAQKDNIPLIDDEGNRLVLIKDVTFAKVDTSKERSRTGDSASENLLWPWDNYKVKVTSTDYGKSKSPIRSTSAYGPTKLTMTFSESISASYSATCSVSSKVVEAGVGFSVTKSYTVQDSAEYTVRKGKYGTIKAYTKVRRKKFDVYKNNKKIGSGSAIKPIGVIFYFYER